MLSPAYLPEPVQVHKDDGQILWFEDFIAKRLMTDNPRMFEKVGERTVGEEEVEEDESTAIPEFGLLSDMTKKELEAYAKGNFGVDLDMRHNRRTLIEEVKALIGRDETDTEPEEPE